LKKHFITILTILGIQCNFAYSATEHDDDAARGVQSLWNASNERRDIFTAEGDAEAHTKANARTPDINNRIAKATVSDRKATRVETARILSAVMAGEFIAHANGTIADLCYDEAIAFNPTHRLHGHHTVLKLTQEIARSCMGHYEFSYEFDFSGSEKSMLRELSRLTKYVDEDFFKVILHNAYYAHYGDSIVLDSDSNTYQCLEVYAAEGACLVAGGKGTQEGDAIKQKMYILAIVALEALKKREEKLKLPTEITAFLEKQGAASRYKGTTLESALKSEAEDYLAKRREYRNLAFSFGGQSDDLFASFFGSPGRKNEKLREIGPGMWQMTYSLPTAAEKAQAEALEIAKSKRKDELFTYLKSYPKKELMQLIWKTGNQNLYYILSNTSGKMTYRSSSSSSHTVNGALVSAEAFYDEGSFDF
jgi:hypothetical protein